VARVIAPHDPVPLERGLEGGGGVCALRLSVVPGDHADDFEREVAEDALQRFLCDSGGAGLSVGGGHFFGVFWLCVILGFTISSD
jgi:hypothetical protein